MTANMLMYLLQQYEGSPETKFYEGDLVKISRNSFQNLRKDKYLVFDQYDIENEVIFDKQGNERFLRKAKNKWIAISTENSEISPIYFNGQDLNRFTFNIKPLLLKIKDSNSLYGNVSDVTDRITFIGVKDVLNQKVGVYLGLFAHEKQAEDELLSLKSKTDQYHKYFVICPLFEITSHKVLSRLLSEGITCLPFKECLNKKGYIIDFSKLKDKKTGLFEPSKTNYQISEDTINLKNA